MTVALLASFVMGLNVPSPSSYCTPATWRALNAPPLVPRSIDVDDTKIVVSFHIGVAPRFGRSSDKNMAVLGDVSARLDDDAELEVQVKDPRGDYKLTLSEVRSGMHKLTLALYVRSTEVASSTTCIVTPAKVHIVYSSP